MQLDQLLQAAEQDKKALEDQRAAIAEEIEQYRSERLAKIAELDAQVKRIDKVLRAAGANVNGAAPKKKQKSKTGELVVSVGLAKLQEGAEWCAAQKGQFRQAEFREALGWGGGSDTYGMNAFTLLGWVKRIPDPSFKGRFFLEWTGPAKPDLNKVTDDKAGPMGGWRFKDPELRKRAGQE